MRTLPCSIVLFFTLVAQPETVAQMFVPPGFSVDVVAADPQLHQPMAFAFDAKGRLWVVEGHSYPQKRSDGEGLDRQGRDRGDQHFKELVHARGIATVAE